MKNACFRKVKTGKTRVKARVKNEQVVLVISCGNNFNLFDLVLKATSIHNHPASFECNNSYNLVSVHTMEVQKQ